MKRSKAFTLIELAIVLLVIGILAGLMLRNVGIYTIQARDGKRKGDLRNLSVNLVQYNSTYGSYPSTTDLVSGLQRIGVANLPSPPGANEYYHYFACREGANYNHFILRAQLEQSSSTNPSLYADSYNSSSQPSNWVCEGIEFRGNTTGGTISTVNCDANNRYYCIAQ